MWLWIAIEPIDNIIVLGIRISIERSILVAEQFTKIVYRIWQTSSVY